MGYDDHWIHKIFAKWKIFSYFFYQFLLAKITDFFTSLLFLPSAFPDVLASEKLKPTIML